MPDISMCRNPTCQKRNECYRYRAIPDSWQSYIEFKNICKERNNYQWFYEIGDKKVAEIKEKLPEGDDTDCVKMKEIKN